jgi:protein-tyrosine-phosphatase
MKEIGLDLSRERPKSIADEAVRAADVVITMGCGDACPVYPGKRYEDWDLEDPAGKDVEAVRRIRDQIEARVKTLLADSCPSTDRTPRRVLGLGACATTPPGVIRVRG